MTCIEYKCIFILVSIFAYSEFFLLRLPFFLSYANIEIRLNNENLIFITTVRQYRKIPKIRSFNCFLFRYLFSIVLFFFFTFCIAANEFT